MGNICRTCGGECVLVRDDGEVKEYRCVCCDNIYLVRRGEQFPSFEERRAAKPAFAKPAPQAGGGDPALPRAVNGYTRAERAAPEETGGGRLDGAGVYAKCINSVIEVRARRKNTIFSGSGFVIEGGYAITNAHVVAEGGTPAERIEAYACGKTFTAVIVEVGTKKFGDDLALLKLAGAPAELKAVKFAEEDEIKNGQTLFVMAQGMVGALGVRLPVALLVSWSADSSLFHLGLATPASTTVQIILCGIWFLRHVRRQKRLALQQ